MSRRFWRWVIAGLCVTVVAGGLGTGPAGSAGNKTPTNKEMIIGAWKATLADKKDRVEFGVFTFRDDGKFTLERDHFLDLLKGAYTVEADALKLTVTYAADGGPLDEGAWPVKVKVFSAKEIVLELKGENRTALVQLVKMSIPEGVWKAVEEDRKKLQGSWVHVRSEEAGKVVKDKEFPGMMTFKEEKVQVTGAKEFGIFTVSANRKLKAIQFRWSNGQGLANLGAYELNGDRLRICRGPDGVFPEEFKTQGTKNRIDEFKRVEK